VLRSARIPGAKFHRFEEADVERLKNNRGKRVLPVEPTRRTAGPELVDGSQLNVWSDSASRQAQDTFPELIRRLLVATPGVTNVAVPSGDGVSVSGWDGVADSTGSGSVPAGRLCFEFGVGGNPKRKANEDWDNRKQNPGGVDPADVWFVFATPRRFDGAQAWAAKRQAEGLYAGVRVIDADSLAGWLNDTPSVHYWISEVLGRNPRDAEPLETWWESFSRATQPALPAQLFLAGRDVQIAELTKVLASPASAVVIQASWRDDALAFVAASVAESRSAEERLRPLVIRSRDVWDRVIASPSRMVLIPLFDGADVGGALARGHHVVLPAGASEHVLGAKLMLPSPSRDGAQKALEAAGVPFERAYPLSGEARRSMPALVRRLARDPLRRRPDWAQPPSVTTIAPLALLGSWSSCDADLELVTGLAGLEWDPIERELRRWRGTSDPPFVLSGTQWHVTSVDDVLRVVYGQLTSNDLARWVEVAAAVLLELNPILEMEPERRPLARLIGSTRRYSSALRGGVAEGVAAFAIVAADALHDGQVGVDVVRQLVRRVVRTANEDESGRVWRSLSDVLPRLAEAAPEVFLDAVEADLVQVRREPLLRGMFQDGAGGSALYSSSPHTGLLWALETLCWSPSYLARAVLCLAGLADVDPGGRLGNRPLASLHTVLAAWIRHTRATVGQKGAALEQICRRYPVVGWQLLMQVWPSYQAATAPPTPPHYHPDWLPEARNVAVVEWLEYTGVMVGLAIEVAGTDPERLAALGEHVDQLPPADKHRVLEALSVAAASEDLDDDGRLLVWGKLREVAGQHRQFPDAEWAMKEDFLVRLETVAEGFKPAARPDQFAYLFGWRPAIDGIRRDDHPAYDAKLAELRQAAVKETLGGWSVGGLEVLARSVEVPRHLGWTVGEVAGEAVASQVLSWLDSADERLKQTAVGFAIHRLRPPNGVSWLAETLQLPELQVAARREALVQCIQPQHEFWDALDELDTELAASYWDRIRPLSVPPSDIAQAVTALAEHGRAWVAIDLIAAALHQRDEADESTLTPELAQDTLEQALKTNLDPIAADIGYEVGVVLDYLERHDTDQQQLAMWEFQLFRAIEHHRPPKALYASIEQDSARFVELVSRVYRGKHQAETTPTETERRLAEQSWRVLNRWQGLPGRQFDGTVDGDHLAGWVRSARLALAELDRADVGDQEIGQALSNSPGGKDGLWPTEPVRDIIETIGSTELEGGFQIGIFNGDGVTSRGVFDGGGIERDKAKHYRGLAQQLAAGWPRTAWVLRQVADSYDEQARSHDEDARRRADTE
jgi:hypothetical protein